MHNGTLAESKGIVNGKGAVQSRVKNKSSGDFPGGAVVKNLPANAGDTDSIPGPGRSHMPRIRPCATTTEPLL